MPPMRKPLAERLPRVLQFVMWKALSLFLEIRLDAGEYGLLGLHIGAARPAAVEFRLVVIQLDFQIAIEIPVDADAGTTRFSYGHVGISEARCSGADEGGFIDGLYTVSRNQFQCPHSGVAARIRSARSGVAERCVLAGQDPEPIQLPCRAVEVALLV